MITNIRCQNQSDRKILAKDRGAKEEQLRVPTGDMLEKEYALTVFMDIQREFDSATFLAIQKAPCRWNND